jgi:hypothetical protein
LLLLLYPPQLQGGKDASTEFNMFHKKDAIKKYAPEVILGTLSA